MTTGGAPTVRILGGRDERTAYAVVNREWQRGLEAAGITVVDSGDADVLVHHDYSDHFGEVPLPAAGARVAVRPWDFGPYPPRWVRVIEEQYDELWVFTEWARECAMRAGLAPERVRIVPHGVDTHRFSPDGPAHPLCERRRDTFLFVGAAIDRKGVDVALRAYLDAFSPADDVQLVVKDHTGDVFYDGLSRRDDLLATAARADAPSIVYLDDYVPADELAALYRGATCLVHPARAEGWALPVLEALASGTPVIVPRFGAFLDYCEPPSASLVDFRRIRAPVGRDFGINTLGHRELVDAIDFCEPVASSVAAAMRVVHEWSSADRDAARRHARTTAERWSWDAAIATMVRAIRELAASERRGGG
jgi:glycosyltransferase involved in cell wall biosynthesis